MKNILTKTLTVAAASALLLQSPRLLAQDDAPPPPPPPAEAGQGGPGGGPGGPGGPGGDRGDRMKQFRERMNERVKSQLKATDEEWAVIQPLLEKVQDKTRDTMMNRFSGMMGGGRGPRRGGDNNRPGGEANAAGGDRGPGGEARGDRGGPRGNFGRGGGSPEAKALSDAIEGDANNGEIKTKLQALRDQRKKAEAELATAREDLKKVLNLRQEAVLVSMGMLD